MPEKQLRIFLSHISRQSLKKYLFKANIYNGRRNMNKVDLIDMIISQLKLLFTDVLLIN